MNPQRRFKIYATLLYLYPSDYRTQYGEQLLQTVADMVDDAPSPSDRFAVWLRISLDLPITVCKQHFQAIGDFMHVNSNHQINRNTLISGVLFLLPIILLIINRMLMLSGPGRGVPTYYLLIASSIFPVLAIVISGFTLHALLRSNKKIQPAILRGWPLLLVCGLSLAYLTRVVVDYIKYYPITH